MCLDLERVWLCEWQPDQMQSLLSPIKGVGQASKTSTPFSLQIIIPFCFRERRALDADSPEKVLLPTDRQRHRVCRHLLRPRVSVLPN